MLSLKILWVFFALVMALRSCSSEISTTPFDGVLPNPSLHFIEMPVCNKL